MPVEFLSDQEAAGFGRYGESVGQEDLERFFFLDDAERKLVAGLRGDRNRLGFSLHLTTARYLGRFLADPLEGRRPRSWTFWPISWGSLIRRV